MKATVTRPDGTTIKIDGSAEEVIAALAKLAETPPREPYYVPAPITPYNPYWPLPGPWWTCTTTDTSVEGAQPSTDTVHVPSVFGDPSEAGAEWAFTSTAADVGEAIRAATFTDARRFTNRGAS